MAKLNSVDLLKVKMFQINIFPLHLHFLRKILNHMYFLQQFEVLLFLHQKTPISAFYMLLEHPDSVNILILALHHHKNILYYYHSIVSLSFLGGNTASGFSIWGRVTSFPLARRISSHSSPVIPIVSIRLIVFFSLSVKCSIDPSF